MKHNIRKATINDNRIILEFINELALYEKLADSVLATIQDIDDTLFCDRPKAEVLILEMDNQPVGFALFFHSYSTFLGKYGIYIEDVYIKDIYRREGGGKALLQHICSIAKERNCGMIEWRCSNWNKSSIDFYLKLGAKPMLDRTTYRLNKEQIDKLGS